MVVQPTLRFERYRISLRAGLPPCSSRGREFACRRGTGVTRVRSFTPGAPRNTREQRGEKKISAYSPVFTKAPKRSADCDRRRSRHRRFQRRRCRPLRRPPFRRQQKRTERTIKTERGRGERESEREEGGGRKAGEHRTKGRGGEGRRGIRGGRNFRSSRGT